MNKYFFTLSSGTDLVFDSWKQVYMSIQFTPSWKGFQVLEGLLGEHNVSLSSHSSCVAEQKLTFPCHWERVDIINMPIEGYFENRAEECRERILRSCPCPYHFNLLVAMVYNLGLAFHLYARQLHDRESCVTMLNQSHNLYSQAKRLHATYGSDCLNTNYLENNMNHLHNILRLECGSQAQQPSNEYNLIKIDAR